ncbi:transposable element tcb1 transposase [Trichonephila clavipes]|uniref:Transposable element tcb1 transposase n=1 Tax=Trichonephila clavipes TaxID=2585209 RepID=A0A8X6VJL7_TRICX|nr:transposable element tcb1 transposase [Trichonephila clavipes]
MSHILRKFQQASKTVVSINTIRKEAHLLGFHGCAADHKPLIRKTNRTARLRWCKALQNWTVDEWKQVLMSDESRCNLDQLDGRVRVRCMSRERFLHACTVPTVKLGGSVIISLGIFSLYRLGLLILIHGKINTDSYSIILVG